MITTTTNLLQLAHFLRILRSMSILNGILLSLKLLSLSIWIHLILLTSLKGEKLLWFIFILLLLMKDFLMLLLIYVSLFFLLSLLITFYLVLIGCFLESRSIMTIVKELVSLSKPI